VNASAEQLWASARTPAAYVDAGKHACHKTISGSVQFGILLGLLRSRNGCV